MLRSTQPFSIAALPFLQPLSFQTALASSLCPGRLHRSFAPAQQQGKGGPSAAAERRGGAVGRGSAPSSLLLLLLSLLLLLAFLALAGQLLPFFYNFDEAALELATTCGLSFWRHQSQASNLAFVGIFFPHISLAVLTFYAGDFWILKQQRDLQTTTTPSNVLTPASSLNSILRLRAASSETSKATSRPVAIVRISLTFMIALTLAASLNPSLASAAQKCLRVDIH